MIGMQSNGTALRRTYQLAATRAPAARQALLRNLAIQTERGATRRATGAGAPGSYPIPVRSGFFRRAFGFELKPARAIVFNTANYARPLHDGFRPYGNPAATPIRPRPYFADTLAHDVDFDAAADAWEGAIE